MAERLWRPHELAAYATLPWESRGRLHAEREDPTRSPFQRDRDRIIHSTAFRRLEYKTQVFVNHEGDLFRTRLTHSIEVAQIGRTLARALGLGLPHTADESAALLHPIAQALLDEVAGWPPDVRENLAPLIGTLHRAGWRWAPAAWLSTILGIR